MFFILVLSFFSQMTWAGECVFPNAISIAWTLGTGIGHSKVQTCISELEQKAILKGILYEGRTKLDS